MLKYLAWYTCFLQVYQAKKNDYKSFKKNDYKLQKGHPDLRFLLEFKKNNLISKFLQFKVANRHLRNSIVYKKCQIKQLEKEFRAKRKRINILEKDTNRIREKKDTKRIREEL